MEIMKTPQRLDLDITNRCNLRCKYCCHFKSAGDVGQDLPAEEWLEFFEELNRCAVMTVTIAGGEPFIRRDLSDLIEGIVRNRMRYNILSNGTLITEDLASFIASTRRCDSVQVSIDGSAPSTHDACRGHGAFQKAIEGLERLRKHDIPVTVRVTIHRHNVADLEEIAKLLLEDLALPGFSTNAASYLGLCRSQGNEVQLTIENRCLAMETLLRLDRKYKGRIDAAAGPLAEAKRWLKMSDASQNPRATSDNCGYLTGCGGAFSNLAVRADGVIVPCNLMGHIELGRINKDDIAEIWQNHPELARIRERRKIPLSDFEFCRDCDFISTCTGNCPALAYTIMGQENHPSPDSCLRHFLEQGGRLPEVQSPC